MKNPNYVLTNDIMSGVMARRESSLLLYKDRDKGYGLNFGLYGLYMNGFTYEVHLWGQAGRIDLNSSKDAGEFAILMDCCGKKGKVRLVIYKDNTDVPFLEYNGGNLSMYESLNGYIWIQIIDDMNRSAYVYAVFCGNESSMILDSSDRGRRNIKTSIHLINSMDEGRRSGNDVISTTE